MEIVIPDFDDDDDLNLPSFVRSPLGTPTVSSPEDTPRADNFPERPFGFGRTQSTPGKSGLSFSASAHDLATLDPPTPVHRLGKQSNGSATSLGTHAMQQSGSGSGLLGPRKGSFASLKNVFKSGADRPPPPPMPNVSWDSRPGGYPALRNPFTMAPPSSPPNGAIGNRPRANTKTSMSSVFDRSRSQGGTAHSSQRSLGARSTRSDASSTFRAEDHPLPALPRLPLNRSTPSRIGRQGSDTSMFIRQPSISEDIEHFGKTPAEEALRVVFHEFRDAAEKKIKKLMAKPINSQVTITASLEGGQDPAFDELLLSLANCARRHARRVLDLLFAWCRLQCDNMNPSEVRSHLTQPIGLQIRPDEAVDMLTSRKQLAAKYIYHRALIEIVRIVPPDQLGEEVALNLEHAAFSLFRSERADEHAQRRTISALLVDFLGELSKTRFLTVSERFTHELTGLSSSGSKDAEAKVEHVLKGVRKLKLRVYPESELEMSAEFLQNLAVLFGNVHGSTLKYAYAETFTHLLHPVIETATAEVNHPMWAKVIASVLQRAMAMAAKQRYWSVAFPLVVVALAVSPREIFMENWQTCIDVIAAKSKDRACRVVGMNAFIRLLWVYLNRCPESSTSTRKRLEGLLRHHFPQNSSQLLPPDLPLEPFVAILHYVMTRQFDYGTELVGEFMRDAIPTHRSPGGVTELLHSERAYVAVRAATRSLRCIANDRPVMFPSSADFSKFEFDGFDCDTGPFTECPETEEFIKTCGPMTINVLLSCDRTCGNVLLSSDVVTLSVHASSASLESSGDLVTRKHGDIHVAYPSRYEAPFRLMTAILDALPSLVGIAPNITDLVNILCRATFSANPTTCEVASNTIRRLAEDDPALCRIIVDNYRQFVFESRNVFRDHFVGTRLLDSQLVRVVKLWVDVLGMLATHQRASEDPDPVDSAFVEKIEAMALFLLTSASVHLRKLAYPVLTGATDMIGQGREPSAAFRYSRVLLDDAPKISTVLQMYESTISDADFALLIKLPTLSPNARTRLEGYKGTKLMRKIAESESTKDAVLWASILPAFIGKVADQLAGPVKELQIRVAATVLRLHAHVNAIASAKPIRIGPAANRSTSDAALLADQWRLYLSVLCATVDATHSTPASRKDTQLSMETLLSPQLFQFLAQLLAWDDRRFQDAVVYALGSISQSSLRSLSETLVALVRRWSESYRATNRRPTAQGMRWTAAGHVFCLISPLILEGRTQAHIANLSSLIQFVKITLGLLADTQWREDYDLQNLRRWFCVVVDNLTTALGQLDSSDRFLGEDVRGAIFKLCYDWCHVGRRPDVAKARESATLQAAADSYRGERDKAQYLDDLQAKTKLLSAAAAEAMASLCLGKLISAHDATPANQSSDHIVDPLTVLRWIRGMFQTSQRTHHETGRKALHALIKYNWGVARLADEVLHQSFGEGEHFGLEASFFGVVADMISDGTIKLPPAQLACLSLSKLGHPTRDVRLRAFQLAVWLFHDSADQLAVSALLPSVGSDAPNVYRHAQIEMTRRLANLYPNLALPFLTECTSRLGHLEAPRRGATLRILPTFLQVLELETDTSQLGPEEIAQEQQALSNLVYLVVRFSDDHLKDIQDIIVSFAGSRPRNTTALVKFLFEQGAKRSSEFVQHAQQIIACLAATPAGDVIFEDIYGFVEPTDMATSAQAHVPASPSVSLANLDALFSPTSRTKTLSQGQMALLFAGELLPHRIAPARLSVLLHVAFIHCDDPNPVLREQAQRVLFQVVRAWLCDLSNLTTTDPSERVAIWNTAELKTTALALHSDAFWKTDDHGSPDTFFHAPAKMSTLVAKILGIFSQLQPKLGQQWGSLALHWASSCTIRHLACRSFQVFRILSPDINARMVSDMLARLSSTIASPSAEIQSFNNEVMRTLSAIVQSLSPTDIKAYPQIFWCSMACLTTPYESEFNEVVDLLSHVLDKTNLADPAVVKDIVALRPPDLKGPTMNLQPLLLIGLRSSKTDMLTFDVIRRLTSVPEAELIDEPDRRLLHGFVAALPWMLHSTDLGEPNEELAGMASDLADIAERQGDAGLARLLTSFARARFRTKDDFIRQAASHLRDHMATDALEIVTLLLGFVLNQNDWMRDKALQILKLILSFPEARALAPHSRELVRPLLRLVSTKHTALALDILELPFAQTDMDSTTQLFGAIEPSGWSIPNPAERSEVTRANVSAVFNTCASRAASAHFSVLQFSDIRAKNEPWGASQISLELPSPPVPDNASMGDLVGALHSLNQFFDEGLDVAPASSTSPLARRAVQHAARMSVDRPLAYNKPRYALSNDSFASSDGTGNGRYHAVYDAGGGGLGSAFALGAPAAASTPKRTGLYVHAAHQPSFSSESEFGAAASDNVFSLDDSHEPLKTLMAADDMLDTPVRPWQGSDRSGTPSPRDHH